MIVVSEHDVYFPIQLRTELRDFLLLLRSHAEVAKKPHDVVRTYDGIEILHQIVVHSLNVFVSYDDLAISVFTGIPRPIAILYNIPVVKV